ncbi:chromate transporter [Gorillibacterium sp. sgz5001074]|uniref:chromate transporter n=1 Tax=Gorillibacterium sp. sgz5001074 TaxID=3446695 RepID=UPI003F662398
MVLWELFQTFWMIGLVSFGGGYAMIPVIQHHVERNSWMTNTEFTDMIAVAGMSPGPIGTNSAIFVGYRVAGFPGALASAAGMTLPSLLVILVVAAFFMKMHHYRHVQAAFYGLRPVVAGLILYGAVRFATGGSYSLPMQAAALIPLGIFAVSLTALIRYRVHPVRLILLAGLVGMAIYG